MGSVAKASVLIPSFSHIQVSYVTVIGRVTRKLPGCGHIMIVRPLFCRIDYAHEFQQYCVCVVHITLLS